jgi:hypothetical protein
MSAVLPTPAVIGVAPETSMASRTEARPSVDEALARLARSRELLRTAMLPKPSKGRPAGSEGIGEPSFIDDLIERARQLPGVAVVLDAVESWWSRHPLHTAATVAAEASRRLAEPIAERNPLMLMAGAFAIGALLIVARPWRWILRPVVFAGLIPAIATRAIRGLSVNTLADLFTWYSAPSKRSSAAASRDPPDTTPPPHPVAQPTAAAPMQH